MLPARVSCTLGTILGGSELRINSQLSWLLASSDSNTWGRYVIRGTTCMRTTFLGMTFNNNSDSCALEQR